MKKAGVIDLGLKAYGEAYKIQMQHLEKRINGKIRDTLLLVEHPPVITIGRGGTEQHLLMNKELLKQKGISLYETNRGGDITYHGPGQLVGYPIFDLKEHGRDLHQAVRNYEESIIRTLAEFDIKAGRIKELTGVWVGDEKVAAIGVGVRKWVTFHGFALNVNNDLTPFSYIIPCGIRDKGVTSMKKLLGQEVDMQRVKQKIVEKFGEVFNLNFNELPVIK